MIRVFRFLKDVRHEPAPQYSPHTQGAVIIVDGKAYGPKVNDRRGEVIVITGHGLTDEFKIGVEVEELIGAEAQRYIKDAALAKLTPDERAAVQHPIATSERNASNVLRKSREEFLQESGY